MKIKVVRRDGFKMPERAHYNDSGADCFAQRDITVPAHGVMAVPTGVSVRLPDGYDLVVHCKSGMSRGGIFQANAPVDAGYTGEIHAILYNSTDYDYFISKGTKIGQFVVRPVIYADFVEELGEERKGNAFGSTGVK